MRGALNTGLLTLIRDLNSVVSQYNEFKFTPNIARNPPCSHNGYTLNLIFSIGENGNDKNRK